VDQIERTLVLKKDRIALLSEEWNVSKAEARRRLDFIVQILPEWDKWGELFKLVGHKPSQDRRAKNTKLPTLAGHAPAFPKPPKPAITLERMMELCRREL
jgi:hypothetical protein